MGNPKHSLFWMAIYLGLVAGTGALLFVPLRGAFMANWAFNGLILAVLAIGIVICLQQVTALLPEITWIQLFRTGEAGISVTQEPRLLEPLSRHLQGRRKDRSHLLIMGRGLVRAEKGGKGTLHVDFQQPSSRLPVETLVRVH